MTVDPTHDLDDDGQTRRPSASSSSLRGAIAAKVTDLHVEYEIMGDRRAALRRRFVGQAASAKVVIHALKGVSFELYEGDAVGVIGSNGSGKSTLLAALAGLLPPASGEILVSEEPKLLGVGAALLPSASGLRNVRLGLLALGVAADDVEDVAEQVIEFAEVGDAIHRPLRTYSSGMRARLHFAIATAVMPRILLVDEALSVGDRKFRRKASEKMNHLLDTAGSLMLVSHSLAEVERICNRVIWIEQGAMVADDEAAPVLAAYAEAQ
jgi:teichoic acid transport system ATP-binding protein